MNIYLAGLLPVFILALSIFLFIIARGLRNYQGGGVAVFFGILGALFMLYFIMVAVNMIMCYVKKDCDWNDNKNFEYPFFI